MSFDASPYEGQIRAILQAPGVDLSTISAKRVRRQLADQNDDLTPELVKVHKDVFDVLIGNVYEQVSAASGEDAEGGSHPAGAAGENGKRKHEDDESSEVPASPPSPKKRTKKVQKSETLTDEELARQLQNEINGRDRPSRAAAPKPAKPKPKRVRKAKSAAVVNSDGEVEEDGEPKKKRGGFSKEYVLRYVTDQDNL